eukprot:761405-Hanusia_phi.AAC.5
MAWRRRVLQEEAMMERKKTPMPKMKSLTAVGFRRAARNYPWASDSARMLPMASFGSSAGRQGDGSRDGAAEGRAKSEPNTSRSKVRAPSAGSAANALPPRPGEFPSRLNSWPPVGHLALS